MNARLIFSRSVATTAGEAWGVDFDGAPAIPVDREGWPFLVVGKEAVDDELIRAAKEALLGRWGPESKYQWFTTKDLDGALLFFNSQRAGAKLVRIGGAL